MLVTYSRHFTKSTKSEKVSDWAKEDIAKCIKAEIVVGRAI